MTANWLILMTGSTRYKNKKFKNAGDFPNWQQDGRFPFCIYHPLAIAVLVNIIPGNCSAYKPLSSGNRSTYKCQTSGNYSKYKHQSFGHYSEYKHHFLAIAVQIHVIDLVTGVFQYFNRATLTQASAALQTGKCC